MPPDDLDILAAVTTELLHAPTLDRGLQALTDAALSITAADHASVRLLRVDQVLAVGARSGAGADAPPASFLRGQGLLGWVAETGHPICLADASRHPRFEPPGRAGFPIRSLMSVPIAVDDRTLGVLSLSARDPDLFGNRDQTVAKLLANSAAHALRTAELERIAITDADTLAFNRRHLLPRLREEMERADRHDEPLGLLLMDLDRFKRVNDEHGHATGDRVLRAFVERVRASVRSIDVLVRRGGEEFVLILPATDAPAAHGVAERIRRSMAGTPLLLPHGVRLYQTVSIGAAVWDGQEAPESLDERADRAMYAAKRAGRDRTVMAPPTTPALRDDEPGRRPGAIRGRNERAGGIVRRP